MRLLLLFILSLNLLYSQKIALLIGNNEYSFAPLNNSLHDVDGIYNTLKEIGFKDSNIKVLKNISKDAMKKALLSFEDQASSSEIALIYFSGHSIQVNNINYVFPANTIVRKQRDLQDLINLDDFIKSATSAKSGIVLIDASRKNPLIKHFQNEKYNKVSSPRGLNQISPKEDQILIGFSKSEGDISEDGNVKMSSYSKALSERLKENHDIHRVLRKVQQDVMRNHEQYPTIFSTLNFTVCLTGSCIPKEVVKPKVVVTPKEVIEPKVVVVAPKEVIEPKVVEVVPKEVIEPKIVEVVPKEVIEPKVVEVVAKEVIEEKVVEVIPEVIPEVIHEVIRKYALTINPIPSSAKVYIMNIQPSYKDGIKLKEGKYTIKVKLDGYKSKVESIYLKSNLEKDISLSKIIKKIVEPTPIVRYALTINPIPSHAKVSITNIKFRYKDGIKLEEGRYTIKVKLSGYKTKIQKVYLKNNLEKDITLSKIVSRKNDQSSDTSSLVNKEIDTITNAKKTVSKKKTLTFKGVTYTGEEKNSLAHGKGRLLWDNGNSYTGDFVESKRTGRGTLRWANGNKYIGDFINDKRTGKGSLFLANGAKYIGSFVNGKRTGKGTYTWRNGDRYIGDFVNDRQTGMGTYIWASGKQRKGLWKNGLPID
ncbi:MORN repeat protein [hydrothermal vent metagenome]|uniref:MORN repeat protein n=1 Tax=hydrothermal vent metagenome TaxID=652676 RepID=A0A1W1CS27_9ZZZZ